MQRSEHEDRILRELLKRLSEEGVPTEQDIAQVDALLEQVDDLPMEEDELRAVWSGARALFRRRDTASFLRGVGSRLADARASAGFGVAEAAGLVQLTECELRMTEEGSREPFFHEVLRLAELYAISLDSLAPDSTP